MKAPFETPSETFPLFPVPVTPKQSVAFSLIYYFFPKRKKEEKKKERNGKKKGKRGKNKRKGEKKEKSIRSGLIGGERKGEWDEIGEIEVTISRERERERQRSKLKPRFNVSGRESAYHTRRSQSTN